MARMTKRNSAELEHSDHDITPRQMKFIEGELLKSTPQGFFIARVDLPASVGTAPNALYGPAAGDPPVTESEVFYSNRGSGRAWEDRLVSWPTRRINYVHAIGIRNGDELRLFTVYGGPLAPQHPDDPTNRDPEGSRKWWSQHALSGAQWAPKKNPRSRRNSYDYWTPPSAAAAMRRERDVYHRAYDDAVAAGMPSVAAQKHAESVAKTYREQGYPEAIEEFEARVGLRKNPRSRRNSYDYWSWAMPSAVDAMHRERDVYHRAFDAAIAAGYTSHEALNHAQAVAKTYREQGYPEAIEEFEAQISLRKNPRSRRRVAGASLRAPETYSTHGYSPKPSADDMYHIAYDDAVAAGLTPAAAKKHAESVLKALMGARKTRRGGRMVSNPADYTLAELADVLSAAISQADTAIDSMDSMEAVREIRLVEYQLREMGLDHMADLLAKAMTAGSMDEYKVEYMLHRLAGTESPRELDDAQRIKFERAFHAMMPRR